MSRPVVTPRRVFVSISELATLLEVPPHHLYWYLEWAGHGYRLKPLDERAYTRWHRRIWRPAITRKRITQREAIIARLQIGETPAQVAAALGCAATVVRSEGTWARRHGLLPPARPASDDPRLAGLTAKQQRMVRAFDAGLRGKHAAYTAGVSQSRVSSFLARYEALTKGAREDVQQD